VPLWPPASVISEYLCHIVCVSEANKYKSVSQSVVCLFLAANDALVEHKLGLRIRVSVIINRSGVPAAELSMGPFCVTRPNPTQPMGQPNPWTTLIGRWF